MKSLELLEVIRSDPALLFALGKTAIEISVVAFLFGFLVGYVLKWWLP